MLNRKLIHSAPRQTAVMAAFALLIFIAASLLLLHQPTEAQANTKAISNLSLSSTSPGELVITWDAPSDAPDDYRVTWKKSDGKWPSYKNENTAQGGNAFPTESSHTVTGLEEGTEYSARVRTRYHDGNDNVEESGPWSTTLEIAISSTPAENTEGDSNEGDSNEGDSNEGDSKGTPTSAGQPARPPNRRDYRPTPATTASTFPGPTPTTTA